MIRAQDEPRLWLAFADHVQACATCRADAPSVVGPNGTWEAPPMCDEGQALYLDWSRADAICARRDQEELDEDCADDERAPWRPEI